MSIYDETTFINKIVNYRPLEEATKAKGAALCFMDGDMIHDRRARLCWLEWKSAGARVSLGQGITFDGLIRTGLHTAIIVWGSEGIPTDFQVWGQMPSPRPCTLGELADLLIAWDTWAKQQRLPDWREPEWRIPPYLSGVC
jgi:hypothetical protein